MSVHDRIESAFEAWGHFVCRNRWATTLLVLGVTAMLVAQIPKLTTDFSDQSFLSPGDPTRAVYDRFREQFDRDDRILIGVAPPDVFTPSFLGKLRAFHEELERELPYVDEITSLVNARWTRGERDELIVGELFDDWPKTAAEIEAARERVFANPLYVNTLISHDGRFTVVTIKPFTYSSRVSADDPLAGFDEAGRTEDFEPEYLTAEETSELVARLDAVVARYEAPDFPLHAMGSAIMAERMREVSERDVTRFVPLSLLTISILLFVLFRRVTAVILPLLVISLAPAAAMGCMAWLEIPFSVTFQIVPTFLIAVGVCDSVHILTITYRELASGREKEDAISFALGHSAPPVVMTSLTTAGGLASFVVAEIQPVVNLGIVTPIGILLALFYSLTLLPALLAIVPLASADHRSSATPLVFGRFLAQMGELAANHPWRVLLATGVVTLVAIGGILRVRFSHDVVRMLPEGDPHRTALELVDRALGGSTTVEILVDSGRENGLHEPDALRRLEAAMALATALGDASVRVGKAISIVDLVKETHQALNENRPSHYVLPGDRKLIAQELLLFENSGSDDIGDFTDTQFRTARITLRVSWVDAYFYGPFLARLDAGLRETLGDGMDFQLTGSTMMFARTFMALISSLARSYVLALLIITPLMILLIGNLERGLVSMIPNLIPVALTLGLMGWMNIPLDFTTLLIGSIVIGLAVDDTIHFMHGFNRYFARTGDARAAIHETLASTGSAMLVTSAVLTVSFALFVLGYLVGTAQFGILVAFATVVAFLADVLVAPALMILITRRRSAPTRPSPS